MKSKITLLAILAITLVGTGVAFGDSSTGSVSLKAEVTSIAELTLGSAVIDFPATNPSTVSIPGSATTTVTANVRTGSTGTPASLVAVGTNLTSASDTILISNVTSSYTGDAGFFTTPGTPIAMATTPVTVGSGNTSGSWTGAFTWALANSWTYANGSYTATISYTLTAP